MAAPTDCHVLVVGAGITGAAAAYHLSRQGVDVLVVEAGLPAERASGANAGSLHAQIQHESFVTLGAEWARGFAPALRLLLAAVDRWEALGPELGVDLHVQMRGGLVVASTTGEMELLAQKVRLENALGVEAHVLSRRELDAVAPYVAADLVGGALWPREGKADSLTAVLSLLHAATTRGARLLAETRVVDIETVAGERHRTALLSTGGRVRAERIIVATGADDRLLRAMGVCLPMSGDAMQVSVTAPTVALVEHLLYFAGSRLTVKQSPAGSILIGGGWPATIDSQGRARVRAGSITSNLAVACRVVPALAGADLLRTWAAVNNGVVDQLPVVGEVAPGVLFGTFPYLGFTAGPVLGEVLGDLALGRTPAHAVEHWSPYRFPGRGVA